MDNKKHYLAGISAFVIWGFISIPLRALSDFSVGEILYFRILFSLVFLAIVIFVFKKNDFRRDLKNLKELSGKQRTKVVALTLVGGALLIVNWLTFIFIVNNINIKTASFSYMICPVITAVLGYVLLKEKLTTLQWIAVGLCALSCVLIGLNSALELGYSFLTAFTYALYLVSQRKNQGFDRLIMLGIQMLVSFLILNLFYSFLLQQVPASTDFYSIIVIVALVFTVLPLFLNLYALNKLNSATIGILLYLNPIINFTVAFIVFKERIEMIQVAGYLVIIVALILFNYPAFRKIQGAMAERFG